MNAADLDEKRLRELALRALHGGRSCFTRFLEPSMEAVARRVASDVGVQLALWGGCEGAERQIAAFYAEDPPNAWEYPICCLEICWNAKYADVGHRDLLGAVMGLGLARDATGDIAFGEGEGLAYLFAHADMQSYLCANLDSAGRASLRLRSISEEPRLRPPEGRSQRVTVATERMDALLAAAYKLSRAEAQRLIAAGLVKRNHVPELRSDVRLEENDLLSVRGYGRMRVEAFEGSTRRGREAVRLFLYTH